MKGFIRRSVIATFITFISTTALADIRDEVSDRQIEAAPIVLSPVRMSQALRDAPAAVSIITREQITRFGLKTVPDALRRVPGFESSTRGGEISVYYHASNTIPRRMNVMIDGVTYFRPSFTAVDWAALPIAMEDIERIEVTRAPSAASYGSNSFSAVINIVSANPHTSKNLIAGEFSSHDDTRAFGRVTQNFGNTSLRVSAETENIRGFDRANDTKHRADSQLNKLNIRSLTDFSGQDRFEFVATMTQGNREVLEVDNHQASWPDIDLNDFGISGALTHTVDEHQVLGRFSYFYGEREQDWKTCQPAATFFPETRSLWDIDHGYVLTLLSGGIPTGGTPAANRALFALLQRMATYGQLASRNNICSVTNQNYSERNISAEVQDTWQLSNSIRMVGTLGYRLDAADSETFIGGYHQRESYSASLNGEWRTRWTTLNVGDYFEQDQYSGGNSAPRVVLNIHLTPQDTVRFGWTESFKTPELRAVEADWQFKGKNAQPLFLGSSDITYFLHAYLPADLKSERLISREIGYVGQYIDYGTVINARYFQDEYYGAVSHEYSIYDFSLNNSGRSTQTGFEIDTNTVIGNRWLFSTALSYTDVDANNIYEYDNWAQVTGSLAGSYAFSRETNVGLAYSATDFGNDLASKKQISFVASYSPDVMQNNLTLQLVMDYFPANRFGYERHPSFSTGIGGTSVVEQSYNSKLIGRVKMSLRFD